MALFHISMPMPMLMAPIGCGCLMLLSLVGLMLAAMLVLMVCMLVAVVCMLMAVPLLLLAVAGMLLQAVAVLVAVLMGMAMAMAVPMVMPRGGAAALCRSIPAVAGAMAVTVAMVVPMPMVVVMACMAVPVLPQNEEVEGVHGHSRQREPCHHCKHRAPAERPSLSISLLHPGWLDLLVRPNTLCAVMSWWYLDMAWAGLAACAEDLGHCKRAHQEPQAAAML